MPPNSCPDGKSGSTISVKRQTGHDCPADPGGPRQKRQSSFLPPHGQNPAERRYASRKRASSGAARHPLLDKSAIQSRRPRSGRHARDIDLASWGTCVIIAGDARPCKVRFECPSSGLLLTIHNEIARSTRIIPSAKQPVGASQLPAFVWCDFVQPDPRNGAADRRPLTARMSADSLQPARRAIRSRQRSLARK